MSVELCDDYSKFYQRWGDLTPELHDAYGSWLDDMSGRSDSQLVPIEYDLDRHPEQSIYVPKIYAHDPHSRLPDALYYGGINVFMARSLGALAYRRLSHQLKNQPVSSDDPSSLTKRLIDNQNEGKNTMVITSHSTFLELGYVKALCFQVKKDRQRINMGGVLLNKLMTRQSLKDKKIVDYFSQTANVYF